MDLAPNREPGGDVPARDNPQQEPSIEPKERGTSPVNTVSRNFSVIENPAGAVEVGMFLVVVPWYDSGRLWSENSLLLRFPMFRAFLAQDFIRGLVSGIGLIDIWVGIWEAVHYKESIHD